MKNYDNINWENLAQEYLETGISLTKLSKKYKIGRYTLTERFKKLGIEIVNRQNELKFDETIFDSIDNEEKAYWLGFIYADGYISSHKEGEKKKYTFEISLKGSDIEHLEKFHRFSKHKNPNQVKLGKVKYNGKEYTRCRWFVTNKHLWNTLNSYGCTPNKSLTLQFPDTSIFKDQSLIRHFIRGYFDGDGSFSRYLNNKTVSPHIEIIGTPEFLNKLIEYSNIDGVRRKDKRWKNNTEFLDYHLKESIAFINYIYKDSSVYLNRKYKLYEFFKNGSRSLQEWNELLQTKNGEVCDDNPVVNSETKESESPYSVEIETDKTE